MTYSIEHIYHILHATTYLPLQPAQISVLLTDSRSLSFPEESLFFALTTPKNNGHLYINELYDKGVRNFVVSKNYTPEKKFLAANFLFVKDPLEALQLLAKHRRREVHTPIIGITGSNGKTIVKEWLYQLLSADKVVTRSPRSYNSQIGVPLSVWQLNEHTEIGIFEAGISKPGEMQRIAPIIQPTIGIFTNISDPHQENFDHYRHKTDEKIDLFKTADLIIYCADDVIINTALDAACITSHEIGWSRKDKASPVFIAKTVKEENQTTIYYQYLGLDNQFTIPFINEASIENAIHCLCVMLFMGYAPTIIAQRMQRLEPVAMRLELLEGKNNCLLINDSYNSDINSLAIALEFQVRRKQPNMRQTLILSDILQTGLLPKTLYRKVADMCARYGIERVIGIGRDLYQNQSFFKMEGAFFETTTEFLQTKLIDTFHNELILVKGARRFEFETIAERLTLKKHETILEINLDALIHNFNEYKKCLHSETRIVCMVKADGYGAGAIEIAKTLQDQGANYFAVALADEGVSLRQQGIHTPIMVMNPEFSSFNSLFHFHLEPEVYSFDLLHALIQQAKRLGITAYPIHLKIDTGMHRLGFTPDEIPQLIAQLKKQNTVVVKSVFSHLAAADDPQLDAFTLQQIDIFKQCAQHIQDAFEHPIWRHILNSAGIERFAEHQMEMTRLGIGLYGIAAASTTIDLQPIGQLQSTLLQVKTIPMGETIGYGRKGNVTQTTRIGIVPIGYADGIDRRLGNGLGEVLIRGKRYHTIGTICMDTCMIDLQNDDLPAGERVIFYGDGLPVEELATKLQTIPYEILTAIAPRVKKLYYRR